MRFLWRWNAKEQYIYIYIYICIPVHFVQIFYCDAFISESVCIHSTVKCTTLLMEYVDNFGKLVTGFSPCCCKVICLWHFVSLSFILCLCMPASLSLPLPLSLPKEFVGEFVLVLHSLNLEEGVSYYFLSVAGYLLRCGHCGLCVTSHL